MQRFLLDPCRPCVCPPVRHLPDQRGRLSQSGSAWTGRGRQRLRFTFGFTVGVTQPTGLDKCVMTRVHHFGVVRRVFIALKILRALLFISPPGPGTTDLFTVPIVLSFLTVM